eukprot:TRINITY_DN2518_c0_g1_i2.p1 TRINITY_DN2518_c0_g1~~TRINITY_DN2518_c0_g1_i2.p1  ORF type:complete len:842 (-),score=119.52 TRINITY_DN2518_c0_g1_i2:548-3073(-)
MTFNSTWGNAPRFTQFSALNALQCNMVEERALHPYPPSLLHPPRHVTHMMSSGEPLHYQTPGNMFLSNAGGTLIINATLEDGKPLPTWLKFYPQEGLFQGTPPHDLQGEITVKVNAQDSINGMSASTIIIFKAEGGPIVVNPMESKLVEPGAHIAFVVPDKTFVGHQGFGNLKLSAQKSDGSPLPSWLRFEPSSRTFSGRAPKANDATNLEVRLTATDDKKRRADDLFSIVAVGVKEDHPPIASLMPLQRTKVGTTFSYEVPKHLFTDPDGDELTWQAHALEANSHVGWLHYSSANRKFFGTPTQDDVGVRSIKVCATDPRSKSVCTTFTVQVESPEGPTVGKPIEFAHARVGHKFSFKVPEDTFNSTGGASLKLMASYADGSQLPKWLHFDQESHTFFGTPGPADSGEAMIKLAATDPAGNSVSNIFTINVPAKQGSSLPIAVEPIGLAPHAKAGHEFSFRLPEDTFKSLEGKRLQIEASGPSGGPLPTWLSFDPERQVLSGKPNSRDSGDTEIKLKASDTDGNTVHDMFVINVVKAELSLKTPITLRRVVAGHSFLLKVPKDTFAFGLGEVLHLEVTKPDGSKLPSWLHFDAEEQTLSGTPGTGDTGDTEVKLTAIDAAGDSASDIFPIVVSSPSGPRLERPVALQHVVTGDPFSFTLPKDTFDASGDQLKVQATGPDGSPLPGWLHFDTNNRSFFGKPVPADAGDTEVKVTAIDTASGISASDQFPIDVINRSNLTMPFLIASDGRPLAKGVTSGSSLAWWMALIWIVAAGFVLWMCGANMSYKFTRVRRKRGEGEEIQERREMGGGLAFGECSTIKVTPEEKTSLLPARAESGADAV